MLFQIWSVFYDCASWNRRGNQEKAIHMFLKHNLVYNVQPFRMYHFPQVLQLWGANCLSFFRNRSCLQFLGRGLLHPSKADLPRSLIWLEGLKKGDPRSVWPIRRSPPRNAEHLENLCTLWNWTTRKMTSNFWKMHAIGRIIRSSSSSPYTGKCTTLSTHFQSKVMLLFVFLLFLFLG